MANTTRETFKEPLDAAGGDVHKSVGGALSQQGRNTQRSVFEEWGGKGGSANCVMRVSAFVRDVKNQSS